MIHTPPTRANGSDSITIAVSATVPKVRYRSSAMIPLTLGIIALLLYLTFGTVAETAIVMLSLPFALVGGVWIMWLLDYNLSIAVAVGFIALAGVAAETGVVMLIYLV